MTREIVLVTGPMVGVCTWEPTAKALRRSGHLVHVPDVVGPSLAPPAWHQWNDCILRLIAPVAHPVLIGHSAATVLVADLATRLRAPAMVLVDGDIPPASGPAMWGSQRQLDFVRSQIDENGWLRPWNEWQLPDATKIALGTSELERDPAALKIFRASLPRFRLEWFFDAIQLSPWEDVPTGYILTSSHYAHAADGAKRRGWPLVRLDGTHLHPMLRPLETAQAIETVLRRLGIGD